MCCQDVQLTAANDDNYFVFEDMIYQVMLAFSRDTEVTTPRPSLSLTHKHITPVRSPRPSPAARPTPPRPC